MKIAIVGSGISGLTAAHYLRRHHDIELFEAQPRLGGHTHTVPVRIGNRDYAVDTGFIVFNERTYPGFIALLDELGVASHATEMSFSVRSEAEGIEYSGGSLSGLFAQPSNLLRPAFLGMVRDVLRFYREAGEFLERPDPKVTLGDFLDGRDYSRAFAELHLLPMGAAIWSCPTGAMREFPALACLRFFANHGLLQLRDRPRWRVVSGGSHRYVEALRAPFEARIHAGLGVREIRRRADRVTLRTEDDKIRCFDHVVVATHSDQALSLLADPSDAEREVLASIRYQPNEAVLHTDANLLPHRPRARASWNFHALRDRTETSRVAVTYWMNRLQNLDAPVPLCVTLNHTEAIDPQQVLGRYQYDHPLFDAAALEAQTKRASICGVRRTHYCGAYWGYGFHEDGVQSALVVAERLGRGGAA
ncbi:MAG: FAD-dependent oxidoreductase [Proteobacteria bacterium]|nr:FAD-dependent oxidoreductase [Pseudomonadota bacterium]